MKRTAYVIFLVLIVFAAACSSGNIPSTEDTPTEDSTAHPGDRAVGINDGDIAPDFELVAMDGTTHHLSDYRGKVVLLNFWATWCPYCRAEMPDFEYMYTKAYKDQDFVILAVDFGETKEAVQTYLDNAPHDISFLILLDFDKSIFRTYNRTDGTPQTYIIDRNGVIHRFVSGQWSLRYNTYLCELDICVKKDE